MPAEFVPFLSGLKSRMAAPPGGDAKFAPMTPPRQTSGSQPSSPSSQVAPQLTATSNCGAPIDRETRIEVKRSGDRITHIQVHCRCGETIEVECEY